MGIEDCPIPSSPAIARYAYPSTSKILSKILKILNLKNKKNIFQDNKIFGSDQPDKSFKGPF